MAQLRQTRTFVFSIDELSSPVENQALYKQVMRHLMSEIVTLL